MGNKQSFGCLFFSSAQLQFIITAEQFEQRGTKQEVFNNDRVIQPLLTQFAISNEERTKDTYVKVGDKKGRPGVGMRTMNMKLFHAISSAWFYADRVGYVVDGMLQGECSFFIYEHDNLHNIRYCYDTEYTTCAAWK